MADNFNIISQKQDVKINPAGTGFEDVWEITYRVTDGPSKGTVAMVSVPDDEHDATHVKKIILDKIATLDQIHAL